eukprot:TRINITY_DN584_c1_g1_i1.p1 TRINITY_DN584_c1_g1~~TRINITY_DN584_c1_g1_i1.p1  ORF type:complete len:259 (+),score=81.67 TRINITY_DN584_c1_g1_i1:308-1084(+)
MAWSWTGWAVAAAAAVWVAAAVLFEWLLHKMRPTAGHLTPLFERFDLSAHAAARSAGAQAHGLLEQQLNSSLNGLTLDPHLRVQERVQGKWRDLRGEKRARLLAARVLRVDVAEVGLHKAGAGHGYTVLHLEHGPTQPFALCYAELYGSPGACCWLQLGAKKEAPPNTKREPVSHSIALNASQQHNSRTWSVLQVQEVLRGMVRERWVYRLGVRDCREAANRIEVAFAEGAGSRRQHRLGLTLGLPLVLALVYALFFA